MGREAQPLPGDVHGTAGEPFHVLAVEDEQAVPPVVEPAEHPPGPVQAALVEPGVVGQELRPVRVHEEVRREAERVLEEQPHPAHDPLGGDDEAVVAAGLYSPEHFQEVGNAVGLVPEAGQGEGLHGPDDGEVVLLRLLRVADEEVDGQVPPADFGQDGLQGAGFKISNPNARSSCGCGSSHNY